MERRKCGLDECSNQSVISGYCRRHAKELVEAGVLTRRGMQGCSEPGCDGIHKGRGLCQSHLNKDYYRNRRQSASRRDLPRARKLFEDIGWEVDGNGCWLWSGRIEPSGYGRITRTPIAQSAHRLSYAIHFGIIPRGIQIHHICAVRACVNPMHLQAITPRENTAEMFERNEYKRQIAALKREIAKLKKELKSHAA